MILELGSTTEFIRVTAEYSNAVLVAMLPYFSDFAKKIELPVPTPIKAEHVVRCGVLPWRNKDGGIAGGSITIKGGWSFGYNFGYVNTVTGTNSYFIEQNPDEIHKYYGPVRMTKPEAVELARKTIQKLGISLESVFAEQEPSVTLPEKIGTNIVPHYRIAWLDPRGGGRSVDMDINGDAGRVERMYLFNKNLERPPPKLGITAPIDPRRRAWPQINEEYARRLIPIVLRAVDDYGAKLNLPIPHSLTTNQVARFSLNDNGGWPHSELELTNGWRFIYRNSMVNGYYAPDNLFNSDRRPILLKEFAGKWNMNTNEAIELIRRTIVKLNYPTNLVLMDFKPHVSTPALPGIPRYSIYWWAENEAHDDLKCKVEAEVDASKRELKSLYYDHVAYWNHPPPIDVPLSSIAPGGRSNMFRSEKP